MNPDPNPRPWRSLQERDQPGATFDANHDLREAWTELPLDGLESSRRSFLKLVGFGMTTAAMSCSRAPVQKAIPYLNPLEEIVPGHSYWMATTCGGCPAGCGALARCRDGRPLKLEGLPGHPISAGGLCAVGQASVLSLYDSHRLDGPLVEGHAASWEDADGRVREALVAAQAAGRKIRLLTTTLHSPSTRRMIRRFLEAFPEAGHVEYDALSASSIPEAHLLTHGARVLPRYRFDRARLIVSIDADFLGTWISPVEYAHAYRQGRDPDATPPVMGRHVQLESRLSLTGMAADERIALAPWNTGPLLADLCQIIAERRKVPPPALEGAEHPLQESARRLADELLASAGTSLIVCGTNSVRLQVMVNFLNTTLGNYGKTVELDRASNQRRGHDVALARLRGEIEQDRVGVLIVQGCNPAYDLPASFAAALSKVPTRVSCASMRDETGELAHIVCPEPHFLESWNDAEPRAGVFCLTQPTTPPLRETRTLRQSLARWLGDARDDRSLLEETWREEIFPQIPTAESFDAFFRQALHDGFLAEREPAAAAPSPVPDLSRLVRGPGERPPPAAGRLGLVLYAKVGLPDGRHAHNPWLQELPDPVSKVTWDNYAALAPETASARGLRDGDIVRLRLDAVEKAIELPVQIQPGQHPEVVAVALGYGRQGTDRFVSVGPRWLQGKSTVAPGETIGRNLAPWIDTQGQTLRYDVQEVSLEPVGRNAALACTQDHHSLHVPPHLAPAGGEVRDAVRSVTLADWIRDPAAAVAASHTPHVDLWPDDHAPTGHHWGLVADLTACTGCSACVVSCQAENNIPVVGKDEVRRHREMHWLRIDRYYEDTGSGVSTVHQPMMCQQCDNAPCETVCPVLATVHSSEGLNQQVYNRCVGTRYCANNCPYKVRRFNWFDYPREDRLQNLVLNPDVTVRSRGVMEKCSFCVQRIMEAKAEASSQGRPLRDGDIRPACQQSCPTAALTFGDLADPESAVARKVRSQRTYQVLAELNVKPSVYYQAVVRHTTAREEPRDV